MKRLTVTETAAQTGISEYSIRLGIKSGKYPHITCGKKYLIDLELFEDYLKREAIGNTQQVNEGSYGRLRQVKSQ